MLVTDLMIKLTPPNVVGRGSDVATATVVPKFDPNSDAIDDAAGGSLLKLPPFTIPPGLMMGGGVPFPLSCSDTLAVAVPPPPAVTVTLPL